MKFEDAYFDKFKFDAKQIRRNFDNAQKDLNIAKKDKILEVKFNYAYTALIKAGIALLSLYRAKVKGVPGHHVKIIEKISEILKNESITDIGNAMRSKRNIDFYGGGVEVTEKECSEYLRFVDGIVSEVQDIITRGIRDIT